MDNTDGRREVVVFHFPVDVFSLDTIKRAAYKFTDRFSFEFGLEQDQVRCFASPLLPIESEESRQFEKQFRNEILDQDLRHRIAEETAPLRNTILAYAFSNTGLQNIE